MVPDAAYSRSWDHEVVTGAPAISLAGRVTDAAEVLTPNEEHVLSTKLQTLENRTGHQLVVVTVATLNGQEIAKFTTNLGNNWGIGRKGYDDGVILLVAPKERQVRIAVGYGLEKKLTDKLCKQIIERQILPFFRNGDLVGGIQSGVDALISSLLKRRR